MSQAVIPGAQPEAGSLAERYGWVVLAVLSAIIALFGLTDMMSGGATFQSGEQVMMESIGGTTWQALQADRPRVANLIDYQVRAGGSSLLVMGLVNLAVVWKAFRHGERWAWYTQWVWPLWTGLAVLLLWGADRQPPGSLPVPMISGSIFFVLAVATLLLTYRRFFPTAH